MADEFRYKLIIESTATGTGAEQTVKALDAVERASRDVAATQARSASELAAQADKARVAEFAFYDLDKALKTTGQTNETFTAGQSKVETGTRNNAQALLLFSQGLEDAQFGIRGVLNNIPGLIFALGGGAGLAGAISIAAVGLTQIIPLFTGVQQAARRSKEDIDAMAQAIGRNQGEQIDDLAASLALANEAADATRQTFEKTGEAERNYAASAIDNAEAIANANRDIAALLGLQVDAYAALEAQQQRDAERRRLALESEIAAQRQRIANADESVSKAADELRVSEQVALEAEAQLVRQRAKLTLLRQERDEIEKIAQGGGNLNQLPPALEGVADQQLQRAGSFRGFQAAVQEGARSLLDSDDFQSRLATAQATVDALEERVNSLAGESGRIAQLGVKLTAEQTKRDDEVRAALIAIEQAQQSSAIQEATARLGNLRQQSETLAADLTSAFGRIETSNAQQAAAKTSLLAATEDGIITANEVVSVSENLRTLIGGLQTGMSSSTDSVARLIAIQEQFNASFGGFGERITRLEGAVQQLGNQ
jgi:hypothetical protein